MPLVVIVTVGTQCLQLLQFSSAPQDPHQLLQMTWQVELQPEHHPLLILQLPSFAAQPINNTTAVESRNLPS